MQLHLHAEQMLPYLQNRLYYSSKITFNRILRVVTLLFTWKLTFFLFFTGGGGGGGGVLVEEKLVLPDIKNLQITMGIFVIFGSHSLFELVD